MENGELGTEKLTGIAGLREAYLSGAGVAVTGPATALGARVSRCFFSILDSPFSILGSRFSIGGQLW